MPVRAPRVTVFIPTFNRAELLRECAASILAQTYGDFRLVVLDNASTDATADVAASFDDPRVEYVHYAENTGMLGNQKRCLARLDTEYGLIIADDDLAYPRLLEATVQALDDNPRAGIAHTAFDMIGPSGEVFLQKCDWTYNLTERTDEPADDFIVQSMLSGCRVCASTALMRASAIPSEGFSEGDFPAIDLGLWLRMANDGWQFAFLPETLGAYRIHMGTHSAGFGTPDGPGYISSDDIILANYFVKLRFVATQVRDPGRAARLRRLARRGYRTALVSRARALTLPERSFAPTLRAVREAVGLAPDVLLHAGAWRLVVASLLGRRMVDRIRQPVDQSSQTLPTARSNR
jgi:glycosyltransferase involved in cell wall biosynthesis